jgi:hypothetical protein
VARRVLHGRGERRVVGPAEAEVDHRRALVDRGDDAGRHVGRAARAVGAQHADRDDLRAADAGDAGAVAADRGDLAGHVRAVADRVDAAGAGGVAHGGVVGEVGAEVAAHPAGEIGMAGPDAGVEDGDQ